MGSLRNEHLAAVGSAAQKVDGDLVQVEPS